MGEEMNKSIWSKDYWKGAAKRFSSVRMLAVCAMLLALRIAVGSVFIPLGDSSLRIYFTFFIIALGASVYGPLMAVVAGCAATTSWWKSSASRRNDRKQSCPAEQAGRIGQSTGTAG